MDSVRVGGVGRRLGLSRKRHWETVNPARMQSSWMDILWFYLGDMIFFFSGGGRFGKRCAISQTLL